MYLSTLAGFSFLVKLVLLSLLVLSVLSWSAIYRLWVTVSAWDGEAKLFQEKYDNIAEMPSRERPGDPLSLVFAVGIAEWGKIFDKYRGNVPYNAAAERVKYACDAAKVRWLDLLRKDVDLLSTIASVAPYVGVLGTILGISQCFAAFSASQLAFSSGFAESLVTTAAGLFVAIPATYAAYKFDSELGRWDREVYCFVQRLITDLVDKS